WIKLAHRERQMAPCARVMSTLGLPDGTRRPSFGLSYADIDAIVFYRELTAHVVISSDRQPEHLAQALVECFCRDEAAQEADLACQFACRIALLRFGICHSLQDGLGHNLRRIAF